jgi:two-component system, NtrC family, response regulator HydG
LFSTNRIYIILTFILTALIFLYAIAVHNKIISAKHSGFALNSNNKVSIVDPEIKNIKKGDKLKGMVLSGKLKKLPTVFAWLTTLDKLKDKNVVLQFEYQGKTRLVHIKIKKGKLWPKLAYTLFPGILTILFILFLWIRREKGEIHYFMILTLAAAYVLVLSYTNLDILSVSPFYILMFFAWNVLAPSFLLLFFLRYPSIRKFGKFPYTILIFLPSLISFIITTFLYYKLFSNPTQVNQDNLISFSRIFIPIINLLYGFTTFATIIYSLIYGKPKERKRILLVGYAIFISLLILTSGVFIHSKEIAVNQIMSGSNLLMVVYSIFAFSLVLSTSEEWILKTDFLINRSIVYGVISVGMVIFYLMLSWIMGILLTRMFFVKSTIVTILASVLATAGFLSLRSYVQRYVDKLFFKTKYMYSEVLKDIGERLSTIMELPRLFASLLRILNDSVRTKWGVAFLYDNSLKGFTLIKHEGDSPPLDGVIFKKSLIKSLKNETVEGTLIIHDENKEYSKNHTEFFHKIQAKSVVLLYFQGDLLGFLAFGNKSDDEIYTKDDMDLLSSVGKQASVAIKNAISYTTTLRLSENLSIQKSRIEKLKSRLEVENVYLRKAVLKAARFGDIVGESEAMMEVRAFIDKVADTDAAILILGKSGTGKELVAREIHKLSKRSKRSLVTINCAAIPENLLESELFGHTKGAFTGATGRKTGQFELAHSGTLFLDEIGDMPLSLQAKLLRALQEKEITPVGSQTPLKIDVRVITATNRELKKMVKEGTFREDLYYRINVLPIDLPPLKDRFGDIPLLAQYFLELHAKRMGKNVTGFTKSAMDALKKYTWPGNIRELGNVVERAVVLSEGEILDREVMLPKPDKELNVMKVPEELSDDPPGFENDTHLPYKEAVETFKRRYIIKILKQTGGNKSEAARLIGIRRPYLHRLIKDLDIND